MARTTEGLSTREAIWLHKHGRMCLCPPGTNLTTFRVELEDGGFKRICDDCAAWWKKINPGATIVTIDPFDDED